MIEFEGEIIYNKDYVHEGQRVVKIIQISSKNAPNFSFIPGQFVMISAGSVPNPQDPSRLKYSSMSVASAPHQKGMIELCIRLPEDRPGVSLYLKNNAKIGMIIKVKGAFGVFGMNKEQKNVVFVATGTGIAPLMSMLRHLVFEKFSGKILFFYGCRSKEDFLYEEELKQIVKNNKNFELHVMFSRDQQDGKIGYIQDTINEFDFPKEKEKTFAYICGNPSSVEAQVAVLKEKGFSNEQIHFEKW